MVLSLSHNDLDGISCQILLRKIFKDSITYFNTSYNKIDDNLQIIDDTLKTNKIKHVFITDLSFDRRQFLLLIDIAKDNKDTNFVFIDHHINTLDASRDVKIPSNMLSYIDISMCATALTYIYLTYEYTPLDNDIVVYDYINKVNAYDMWLRDTVYFEDGYYLNNIFWEYGRKRFFFEFSKSLELTERQIADIKSIKKSKEIYFKQLENKKLVYIKNDICISFTDKYITDIQLKYSSLFYINATSYGKIQIRIDKSIQENVCLGIQKSIKEKIPEENIINIGGHHHAFGLEHSSAYNSEKIVSIVKEIYGIIKKEINGNN